MKNTPESKLQNLPAGFVGMVIFNCSEFWSDKVNFVDTNNLVLGYDIGQHCCEKAGWFIHDEKQKESLERSTTTWGTPETLPGWTFDKAFFESVGDGKDFEWGGGMVIFRIVNVDEEKEAFVHLYNMHNGYYHHGFEFIEGFTKETRRIIQDNSV